MARSNLELWQLFYQLRQCNVFLSRLGHFSLKWFFSRRACNGWTETLKLCQLFYQRSCCNMFLCKLGHFSLKMIIFLIVPAVAGLKPLNFGLLSIILPTAPLQHFLMWARPFSLKIIFSRHTCDGMTQTLELCQLFYQLCHNIAFLSKLGHFHKKWFFLNILAMAWLESMNFWLLSIILPIAPQHLGKLGHFHIKWLLLDILAMAGLKPLNFGLLSIILPTAPLQYVLK